MNKSSDDSDSDAIAIIGGIVSAIILVFAFIYDCLKKMDGLEKDEEKKQLIPKEQEEKNVIQSVPVFQDLCPDIPVTIIYAPELDSLTYGNQFVPNYENNDLI
ncbi:Hypothetical_protein [Hexamita inflata]|uniref:Hypothetical_protein n=1 Tax=Hexamita inflata TaxID=28002 RepID=A0AA86R9Q8_9EUKA|nr:Hypothetical protein HINF_LOCUS210 [Hexamita inflata]CAI9964205.1 Hypothetical protein HINF_LOCUS51850 [Hexamita inflata]